MRAADAIVADAAAVAAAVAGESEDDWAVEDDGATVATGAAAEANAAAPEANATAALGPGTAIDATSSPQVRRCATHTFVPPSLSFADLRRDRPRRCSCSSDVRGLQLSARCVRLSHASTKGDNKPSILPRRYVCCKLVVQRDHAWASAYQADR